MTTHDDLATLRRMTGLIRDAVGFALAEKNIPHAPTWTLLVPQHLDDIEAAADRVAAHVEELEAQVAALTQERDEYDGHLGRRMAERDEWHNRAEAAEAALADTRRALAWYDDHKRDDGSYDGEMWGDLRALAATDDTGQADT